MDYKILFFRSITSFFLLTFLYLIIFYFFNYINTIVILIFLLLAIEILINFKTRKYLIILYVLFSFISFEIYYLYFFNKDYFIFIIVLIILFDSFSYLFGSLFGKTKILPNISPGKTFFGFFSSLTICIVFSFIIFSLFFSNYNMIKFNFISLLIIFLSFFGDIIESKFKRINNIKNSSHFLPGHGGIFDRMDSFILIFYFLPITQYFL